MKSFIRLNNHCAGNKMAIKILLKSLYNTQQISIQLVILRYALETLPSNADINIINLVKILIFMNIIIAMTFEIIQLLLILPLDELVVGIILEIIKTSSSQPPIITILLALHYIVLVNQITINLI